MRGTRGRGDDDEEEVNSGWSGTANGAMDGGRRRREKGDGCAPGVVAGWVGRGGWGG